MKYFIAAAIIAIFSITAMAQDAADCQIIRAINYPLAKKQTVKTKKRIALLNTCLTGERPMARPTIGVVRGGKTVYRTFGIIRLFDTRKQANRYAKENGITDIKLNR